MRRRSKTSRKEMTKKTEERKKKAISPFHVIPPSRFPRFDNLSVHHCNSRGLPIQTHLHVRKLSFFFSRVVTKAVSIAVENFGARGRSVSWARNSCMAGKVGVVSDMEESVIGVSEYWNLNLMDLQVLYF